MREIASRVWAVCILTLDPLWEKENNRRMTTAIQETPKAVQPAGGLFDIPGCEFTEVSLTIKPGMKFEHWQRLVRILERTEQAIQWYIGDALNYGECHYGEKYAQVVDAHKKTGIPIDVLRQYQWVADKVKPVTRVTELEWSVHREVASLPEDKQREILQAGLAQKQAGKKYTRRQAERDAAKVKREVKTDNSERVLSKEAREYLDDYMAELARWSDKIPVPIPETDREVIQLLIHEHGADALILRNRTVQSDCEVIVKTMKDTEAASHTGEMAAADLYEWLISLRYFMSEEDYRERLRHMNRDDVRMALLTDAGEEGRQEGRRGALPGIVCVPWRKVWNQTAKRERDEDED